MLQTYLCRGGLGVALEIQVFPQLLFLGFREGPLNGGGFFRHVGGTNRANGCQMMKFYFTNKTLVG